MKFIAIADKPGVHTAWRIRGRLVNLTHETQVVRGSEMIVEDRDCEATHLVVAMVRISQPGDRITFQQIPAVPQQG